MSHTFVRPMLAKVFEPTLYRPTMLVQPKLNGIRAMYYNGNLVSRDGIVWASNCLRHIKAALARCGDIVLDGELYCHGMPLQQINARVAVKRVTPHLEEEAIQFHVFDCVARLPFVQRYLHLMDVVGVDQRIQLVPTHYTTSLEQTDKLFVQYRSSGYEGLMYRMPLKPYAIPGEVTRKDNRVDWLLKRKDWLDLDATIVGMTEGDGKNSAMMGSFELDYNGIRFSAGSGPTDAERHQYWSLGPQLIGCVVKIKYEMLSDGGVPLKPVILQVELP